MIKPFLEPRKSFKKKYQIIGSIISTFAGAIDYYKPLLERYARRIMQDESVAKFLVKKALKDQYEKNGLAPSQDLFKILKADLLNHCYYYKQSQIFDRPLIKIPLRKNS